MQYTVPGARDTASASRGDLGSHSYRIPCHAPLPAPPHTPRFLFHGAFCRPDLLGFPGRHASALSDRADPFRDRRGARLIGLGDLRDRYADRRRDAVGSSPVAARQEETVHCRRLDCRGDRPDGPAVCGVTFRRDPPRPDPLCGLLLYDGPLFCVSGRYLAARAAGKGRRDHVSCRRDGGHPLPAVRRTPLGHRPPARIPLDGGSHRRVGNDPLYRRPGAAYHPRRGPASRYSADDHGRPADHDVFHGHDLLVDRHLDGQLLLCHRRQGPVFRHEPAGVFRAPADHRYAMSYWHFPWACWAIG